MILESKQIQQFLQNNISHKLSHFKKISLSRNSNSLIFLLKVYKHIEQCSLYWDENNIICD